MVIVLISV